MIRTLAALERTLRVLHRACAGRVIQNPSPIAGQQFPGGFNQAPFSTSFHALPENPGSFWGVDRCLRISEAVDAVHSRVFHVGFFAKAIRHCAHDPQSDARFHQLEEEVLDQFLSALRATGITPRALEVTCLAAIELGGHPDGRDRRVRKRHQLREDVAAREFLRRQGVKVLPMPAMANVAIVDREGSLVGPRLEVFCGGLEIATVVFCCFRNRRGILRPVNYTAAYGIGLERVLCSLYGGSFLDAVPRYARARRLVAQCIKCVASPIFTREMMQILSGLEVLALLPARLSQRQQTLVQRMKSQLKSDILEMGLSIRDVKDVVAFFRRSSNRARL